MQLWAVFFLLFLIASEASIYVVDLTTAIELSSIHRPDRLNILLLIYFPLKRKEHFSWHVSPGLMRTYLYSLPRVLYRVCVAMSDVHSTCVNDKTIALAGKKTKTDTLIFSYANVKRLFKMRERKCCEF